ncbi:MAG: hypothetical protein KJO40_13450 [Deltaproteobacteria bacterium]|nr:hypothetical protein [Deltaproteobacteria bacterium]
MICGGTFTSGGITVEMSQNGTNWAPLCSFVDPGKQFVIGASLWLRARSKNVVGSPSVDVGAEQNVVQAFDLDVPAADGVGTSTNVESLGQVATVVVGGDLGGSAAVTLEGSQDDVDYAPLATFPDPGQKTINATVRFLRVRVSGYNAQIAFSPVVTVGAVLGAAGAEAGNVRMPRAYWATWSDPIIHRIYVRLTGDDSTGDGSAGNPYATIPRALTDVPMMVPVGNIYMIDCSNMGTVLLDESILVANRIGDAALYYDPNGDPRLGYLGAVTFYAEPTIVDTIEPADIVGWTTDPDTYMKTLQTSKAWTPGEHEGRLLIGGPTSWYYTSIANNDATDLELPYRWSDSGPLYIIEPSTELRADGVSAYQAMVLTGNQCSIGCTGLKLTSAISWGSGLFSFQNEATVMMLCQFDSTYFNNGGYEIVYSSSYMGLDKNSYWQTFGYLGHFNTYMNRVNRGSAGSWGHALGSLEFYAVIADTCYPLGVSSKRFMSTGGAFLIYVLTRNAKADGIRAWRCSQVEMRHIRVDDSVGSGIWMENCPWLLLSDVQGSGNGAYGLRVQNGGQVGHHEGSAPTGTLGDYILGGNAAAAGGGAGWAAWVVAGSDEIDLGAAKPQLCRLFATPYA